MASITTENNGKKIQFVRPDGRRSSIRLGKVTQRQAAAFAGRVEDLLGSLTTGQAISRQTAIWLEDLEARTFDKLARVGLVEPIHRSNLGPFIDAYTTSQNVKHSTQLTYTRARNHLVQFFGEDRDLRKITAGDADDWWAWMVGTRKPKLAENTARKSVSIARQIIKAARRKNLLASDPFGHLASTVRPNRTRDRFVTRETITQVIDACPDAEWRLMVALARYGGLRIPSEIRPLRWADIDWAGNRFTVRASKTENNDHGGIRIVPIFPELRPYLFEAFKLAEESEEYVIPSYRHAGSNVGTHFKRIIKRAGVTPWPKPWQNLRASCETDLAAEGHGIHVVTDWIGHTPKVALANYLQVTEADFEKAVQNRVQQSHAPVGKQPQAPAPRETQVITTTADRTHLQFPAVGCDPLLNVANGPYRT